MFLFLEAAVLLLKDEGLNSFGNTFSSEIHHELFARALARALSQRKFLAWSEDIFVASAKRAVMASIAIHGRE
jgi:hypothetical protein